MTNLRKAIHYLQQSLREKESDELYNALDLMTDYELNKSASPCARCEKRTLGYAEIGHFCKKCANTV